MKLIGIIHKPVDVEEWPFWTDGVEHLDGEKIDIVLGNIRTYHKRNTGVDKPQDVIFVGEIAINVKWIHNMEFTDD